MQNDTPKTPATITAKSGATAPLSNTVADMLATPAKPKPAPKAAQPADKPAPAAKPAKRKQTAKPADKPAPTADAKPADAKPAATHYHADAGLKSRVARMLNANRKTRILTIAAKPADKLTSDKRAALYDLRAFYNAKPFPARGLDNGILRDLKAASLISVSGGQSITDNGKAYTIDGNKPAMLTITKAGHAYGKA